MGMRDWLIIIVIVGIIVILLDGYRRKRKDSIRVKLEKNIPDIDDSSLDKAELPNGGARVKPRHFQSLDSYSEDDEEYDAEDDVDDLDDEANVPVLMDAVEIEGRKSSGEAKAAGANARNFREDQDELEDFTASSEFDDEDSDDDEDTEYNEENDKDYAETITGTEAGQADKQVNAYSKNNDSESHSFASTQTKSKIAPEQSRKGGRVEPTFGEMEAFSAEELEDKPSHLKSRKAPAQAAEQKAKSKTERNKESKHSVAQAELFSESPKDFMQEDSETFEDDDDNLEPEEVIVINVMAKQGDVFAGSELLPILLQQGMQLGKMSIFHKHRDSQGNGPAMFSMANMVKPGTFDATQMDEFTTPGVSFFLQLPNSLGNMRCFEQMLNAANAIKQTLNGDLKDENRSVITRQTIEHCRQRIQDFELAQLSKK
tara:strand:+ start:1178 stop:2464 length:1287 start_codon:yes stop_codon:yes gene_type:complete